MRKLLQNKAVVSSLCVIAVLFVAGNLIDLPVRHLVAVAARPVTLTANPNEQELFAVPTTPRICAELTGWRGLLPTSAILRDPFAIRGGPHGASASTNAPSTPVFVLQAVSIEAGRALAVINQTIVGPDDYLGDYVVERIRPTEVWLKNSFGRVVVPMNPALVLGTKPLE